MGISFVVSLVFTLLIVVGIVSHISHTTLTKGHTLSHSPSQGVIHHSPSQGVTCHIISHTTLTYTIVLSINCSLYEYFSSKLIVQFLFC